MAGARNDDHLIRPPTANRQLRMRVRSLDETDVRFQACHRIEHVVRVCDLEQHTTGRVGCLPCRDYSCGNEKGLASLQGLDFPSLFGSPTWARTRDLRINRLPLDLAANPHECSLSGVRASNISCPFHLRKAWEGVI